MGERDREDRIKMDQKVCYITNNNEGNVMVVRL